MGYFGMPKVQMVFQVTPEADLDATLTAIESEFSPTERESLRRGGGRPSKGVEPTESQIILKLKVASVVISRTHLQIFGEPYAIRKVFERLVWLIKPTSKNEEIHFDLVKIVVVCKEARDSNLGSQAVKKEIKTFTFENSTIRSYQVSESGRLRSCLSFEILDEAERSTEEKISQIINEQ